ncbi:TonB-dependent receptor [Neolewinella lacunae]|uniref:TonB-dependent receptor n=1 Tax=Neolewinella lacunae TaxID=1517758 RepID=A0A923T6T2_9BACT|nr:TonB-dependent receptor [Neolewinella lacunae]MBC6993745.1 TonB-dependent receptor [Neolewinella lacunae]MDN3635254.1 TonB-dependent receptor [Neolewinella lacunae]
MKQLLCLLLFVLGTAAVSAQTTVSGTILDTDGFPLPGATVLAKGTTSGTVVDLDGNFSFTVPEGVTTLVVSYTGYETQEIALNGETSFEIVLSEGVALDEIVVTGYSVTSKRQATGAISTISAAELTAIPSGNVEQQFQGRAPGVTVITNGQPGTTSIIRIRGFGSFGGNQPLYVVDGVPVDNIEFLNPDDIEATSILKDAASASIYGSRAANGVVVIQTKRGKKTPQPMKVSYNGLVGFTDPGNGPSFLTPQQDADKAWEALRNDGLSPGDTGWGHPQYGNGANPVLPDYLMVGNNFGVVGTIDLEQQRPLYNIDTRAGSLYQVMRANKEGTDWYDAITRTGILNRHTLGFSGSTESARYYVGLGAQVQEGILLFNDFERYSFRVNTEFDLGKYVRVGENLQITHRRTDGQIGDAGGAGSADDENSILGAFRMNPIIPVYDEFGGYAGTRAPGFNNPRNPVAERDGVANNRGFSNRIFGNVYVEVEPVQDLIFRSSFGGGFIGFHSNFYSRQTYENSENNGSFGYGENQGYFNDWTWTNTVKYKKSFGSNNFDVLLGYEAIESGNGRTSGASGINPFSRDLNFINLSTVAPNPPFSNYSVPVKFVSTFGQLNYNWNDKYYLTGVLRRDESSRFGANQRSGTFPAFSAAWRVTAEPFMAGQSFFTDLKIRGGYGEMGNSNNVNANNRFSLFAQNLGGGSYPIDGSNTSADIGFFQNRIGSENARWETSVTSNIGFDATILKGKVDIIMDLWRKETNDLLVQLPLPAVNGAAAAPSTNIGSMLNQGIDMSFIYRDKVGKDFGFEVTLNAAFLENRITKFTDDVEFFENFGTRITGSIIRNQVGQSLSTFWGYQVAGLFQSDAEVASAPTQAGAAPGRFRFVDNNGRNDAGELTGVPDGRITEADRTFLGSAVPDFTGGLNLVLTYKNFDLTTFLYTSLGNEIYNNSKWFTDFYGTFKGASVSSRVLDSWTPQNTDTDIPIYESASNFSTSQESTSYYVEDGSFLRMQNLTLGYTLRNSTLNSVFTNLRLAVSATNLFTITGYDGLDPAVGGAADTNFGVDVGNYPVTRGFNFNLSFDF